MSKTRKILVVGPSWVGDMVMAQSLFKALTGQGDGVEIHVLAPAWSIPILERMPEVKRAIEMPLGHGRFGLALRYRLGRSLRGEHYDQAIIIPRSFKSALVPFFARIPRRTGYRGEVRYGLINDMRILDKSVLTQTVQRYVALAEPASVAGAPTVPAPALIIDKQNQERLVNQFGLSLDKPVVGFMPGAESGPAQCWPPEYFAALAGELLASGYQVWLFGSAKDQSVCGQIAAAAGAAVVDLSGKTRLADVVDLIALTELVVTNDSGLMHVAAATGRRVIAIYGSSSPAYTPPLTAEADIVYLGLECSPCFERQCPLGHTDCLNNIKPGMVARVIAGESIDVGAA